MLSRFQPHKPTPTNTSDAPNPQQLLPPNYFQKSLPPRDLTSSENSNFQRISTQDDSNSSQRCATPATTTSPPQTPPTAIIWPLSIDIPRTSTHIFKSKLQLTNYYKQLISYNNLLKVKESYLNNLLFTCNPQALRIFNSFQSPGMCSNNCSLNFCKNAFCSNNFQKTPNINIPDPIVITDPTIQNPPACAVPNNDVLNICTFRQPLNDLDPDPSIPSIKQEPLSPDISTLHISDPLSPSTSPDPPFIADYTPDKYPLFHISPVNDDLSPIPPSFEI